MGRTEDIINGLNQRLGTDFEFKAGTKIYWFYTNRERVREIAKYLTGEFKARLIHVSVIDRGLDGYEVIYHYSLDHLDQYVHFNVKVQLPPEEPEIESITESAIVSGWPRPFLSTTSNGFLSIVSCISLLMIDGLSIVPSSRIVCKSLLPS